MASYSSFSKTEIRALYKQLLWNAKRFPSKKRDSILQDIRIEFREKASLSNPDAVAHAIEVAVRGLGTMQKYTGLDKKSKDWKVTLEEDPLGAAEVQAKRTAGAGPAPPAPASGKPADAAGIVDAGVKATFGRLE